MIFFSSCWFTSFFYRVYEKLGTRHFYFFTWLFHSHWTIRRSSKHHSCLWSVLETWLDSKFIRRWIQSKIQLQRCRYHFTILIFRPLLIYLKSLKNSIFRSSTKNTYNGIFFDSMVVAQLHQIICSRGS